VISFATQLDSLAAFDQNKIENIALIEVLIDEFFPMCR
jgi:hypothetical protein